MGAKDAEPADGVIDSIMSSEAIIVCPSNPIVSIGTILSVKGVREALAKTRAKKIAITPIIAGAPIKGPADKLMLSLGLEVSAFSVAKLYQDFIDTFILDLSDSGEKAKIEGLGIKVTVTNTIMRSTEDKIELARTVLNEI